MQQTVTVGSKLPFSFILKNPLDPDDTRTIRGLNDAPKGRNGVIMQVPYMTTQVDKVWWDLWYAMHTQSKHIFGPLKSGAIFVADSPDDIESVYRDRERDATGLEQLDPKKHGVKKRVDD